jgi:hypothetical protein
MDRIISIAELLERGVQIEPHEAVAIVQQLIHGSDITPWSDCDLAPGPPSIDRVRLHPDGSVACVASEATPAVCEIAVFLQALLPPYKIQVPGGLRYAIARALLDVDAPPFDSLEHFARALARFERGDRREVVRTLLERTASARSLVGLSRREISQFDPRAGEGFAVELQMATPSPSDRRAPAVSVTELRRQLREADQRLFAQRALPPRRDLRSSASFGRRFGSIAAGVFVGASLIGVGEAMHLRRANASTASAAPARPAISTPTAAVPAPVRHAAPTPDEPKVIDRVQPHRRRTPPAASRRRSVKTARADGPEPASSSALRMHERSREGPGIFPHIKFKWVDDMSSHRQ